MCSVDTCNDLPLEKKLNLIGATCRKCNSTIARIVLQGKFPYCRECFLYYFQHKYISGIGKNKIIRPGNRILLAFSGSYSSVCLLNLMHRSLVEERKKKTKFDIILLYINEDPEITKQHMIHTCECVIDMLRDYNYPIYFTKLSLLDQNVVLSGNPEITDETECDRVTATLKSFTCKTAKETFVDSLRTHVLYEAAKELGCSKIFTGETSDHIAAKIISHIAIGRGQHIPADTGYMTNYKDIPVVRPLRECSNKEVAFYNVFYNLHSYTFPWKLESDNFSSIQNLTKVFLTELQQSFPSTVATISSTGSKLSFQETEGLQCLMCKNHISNPKDLSADEALQISQLVTSFGPKLFDASTFTLASTKESTQNSKNLRIPPLCYSCKIVIRESASKSELLAPYISSLEKETTANMYNEIKDFLL